MLERWPAVRMRRPGVFEVGRRAMPVLALVAVYGRTAAVVGAVVAVVGVVIALRLLGAATGRRKAAATAVAAATTASGARNARTRAGAKRCSSRTANIRNMPSICIPNPLRGGGAGRAGASAI